jgi:hypothetical protein
MTTCEENTDTIRDSQHNDEGGGDGSCQNGECEPRGTRPQRVKKSGQPPPKPATRTRVKDRWFLEPVVETTTAMVAHPEGRDDEVGDKGKICLVHESFENLSENHQNLELTDQPKSSTCGMRLLGSNSEVSDGFADGVNKECLPVNNDKMDKNPKNALFGNITGNSIVASVAAPDSLGLLESVPEYLETAEDTEETAWDIQGLVFHDEELNWCTVTGWGVDHGTNIIFYAPLTSSDPVADEEHASLAEVLSWIKQSPVDQRISDYRSSRTMRKSSTVKSLLMREFPIKRTRLAYGTMLASRVNSLVSNIKILSSKIIVRVLKAQETLFKYGTFIPRNDREAEVSPEASRWRSGRTLEWLRLRQARTFESDWTWERVQKEHPSYLKSDIGYMFYVYDYKYSGEHRVRLVFDGSRQSITTYSVTYAPTVRAESVQLFHLYAVEYG